MRNKISFCRIWQWVSTIGRSLSTTSVIQFLCRSHNYVDARLGLGRKPAILAAGTFYAHFRSAIHYDPRAVRRKISPLYRNICTAVIAIR
ncbi:hypothetical protein ACNKHU_08505 [Shigella flexneri]